MQMLLTTADNMQPYRLSICEHCCIVTFKATFDQWIDTPIIQLFLQPASQHTTHNSQSPVLEWNISSAITQHKQLNI